MGSDGERALPARAPAPTPGYRYVIRVEGLLDTHWSQWLSGMRITHEEEGVTCLEGPLIDQAALYGLLNMRRPLVTVERLGGADTAAPPRERK
jgi:hypothetical protein